VTGEYKEFASSSVTIEGKKSTKLHYSSMFTVGDSLVETLEIMDNFGF
jgi:hypothetical protein